MDERSYPWDIILLVWASSGRTAQIEEKLNTGANVNCRDRTWGRTSLSWAAEKGHVDTVRLLTQRGADFNALDSYQSQSPLFHAIANGHEVVARLLLEAGAHFEICNKSGETPLLLAAKNNHFFLVKLLLEAGANPDAKECSSGQTSLSLAARYGYEMTAKLLLDANAKVDLEDSQGRTPLSWAASSGHESVVQLLLERSASTATKDSGCGWTPLAWAISCGSDRIIHILKGRSQGNGIDSALVAAATTQNATALFETLLESSNQHLDTKLPTGRTLLMEAARCRCEKQFSTILSKGANPSLKNKEGRDALSFAAEEGLLHAVKLLLSRKVDAGSVDQSGRTPLSWCAQGGHVEVAKVLIEQNVKLDVKDITEQTPLSYAMKNEHIDISRLLLEGDVDPSSRDDEGRTPLSYAIERGHDDIAILLLDKGADPNFHILDKTGYEKSSLAPALWWAVRASNDAMVRMLLAKGASLEQCDEECDENCNPFFTAFAARNTVLMKLLLEHGSNPYSPYMARDGPLGRAALNGCRDIVSLILDHDAESDESKNHSKSALMQAITEGHKEIVQILLERCDLKGSGVYRKAWEIARDWGCDDIVELIEPYLSLDK
ncbi:hypothetical protein ACHAPJ_012963 [Fusarium lateritium]